MEIPITGLIIHSNDSDPSHSHQLYITSWNGKPVHVHPFSGSTTFNNGHDHYFAGTTGPSIEIETGGHFNYFEGFTTVNGRNPHSHMYEGTTGNEVFDL